MPETSTDLRKRPAERSIVIARTIFWSWIALQIALPATQLLRPKPARFGWQMYSRALTAYEFEAVLPNGERRSIDLDAHVTVPREEIPWHEILPPRLCPGMPNGTILEIRRGEMMESHRCP